MISDDHASRLEACEKQIRLLRRALACTVGLLGLAGALVVSGFVSTLPPVRQDAQTIPDSLRVRELVIVDSTGTVRVRVGGNLPAINLKGQRVSRRGGAAAGVLLFDNVGRERGGYVTFDRSGYVGLTLDTHGEQVALFGADSTPGSGASARLWQGKNWTEMKVDEAGPHVTVGRAGAVAFIAPSMTEAEGATLCSELKTEVAQARPALSPDAVFGACKEHAPEVVCRKCLGRR